MAGMTSTTNTTSTMLKKEARGNGDLLLTREEAVEILKLYYLYLQKHNMDHLFWDVINQAVIVLGGEGDATFDHDAYMNRYVHDGVSFREVAEEEIRWTERVPEIDRRLPFALRMAVAEMERREWL